MNKLTKLQTEELNFVALLPDDSIDTSDIPEQTDWNNAHVGRFYQGNVELDNDSLSVSCQ